MASDAPNATSDLGFFDGRFMVEIGKWNWGLQVGLSHPSMPRRQRFQGGLMYNRSVEINGRVRAPIVHRGKRIQVWISPFGREIRFDARTDDVGRFWSDRAGARGAAFEADLRLPEEALAPALTCLGSVWKLVNIWVAGEEPDGARVTAYSFASNVHPNLKEWAGPELASD
jgi:hypothetical protein